MKKILLGLIGLLFAVPGWAELCNMLPAMDTWSNGGTANWIPSLYTTQRNFSFPITITHATAGGGYQNVPVKLVKVNPNTKYTLYTDITVPSGADKCGFEVAGYRTEADAIVPDKQVNYKSTFSLGSGVQPKQTTFTTTDDTEYVVVSITNWNSGSDISITTQDKIIMVEGEAIPNTNIPQCTNTNPIRIATTAYNTARFSPVVTELNDTIATIRSVVTNTINQTKAIADLQATKQTRPDETCPAGKKCLLVEDDAGQPHWYEIIESAD